jgi:Family of unknown function (DUF5984)
MLFDFTLVPLNKVHPWGEPSNLHLSWLELTEGFYRLKVGSDYLFNYSNEFINYHADRYPDDYDGSFVDHYIVRLWEDVLSILPDVLNPLPERLCRLLELSYKERCHWYDRATDWMEKEVDRNPIKEEEVWETFAQATSWIGDRQLDSAYLQNHPRIWLWSTEDTVTIAWDNIDIVHEGIPIWSSVRGKYSIPRHQFLEEVRAFNDKLFVEMGERVQTICDRWDRPEVNVDVESLQEKQSDRSTWLENTVTKTTSSYSWQDVFTAIEKIAINN